MEAPLQLFKGSQWMRLRTPPFGSFCKSIWRFSTDASDNDAVNGLCAQQNIHSFFRFKHAKSDLIFLPHRSKYHFVKDLEGFRICMRLKSAKLGVKKANFDYSLRWVINSPFMSGQFHPTYFAEGKCLFTHTHFYYLLTSNVGLRRSWPHS